MSNRVTKTTKRSQLPRNNTNSHRTLNHNSSLATTSQTVVNQPIRQTPVDQNPLVDPRVQRRLQEQQRQTNREARQAITQPFAHDNHGAWLPPSKTGAYKVDARRRSNTPAAPSQFEEEDGTRRRRGPAVNADGSLKGMRKTMVAGKARKQPEPDSPSLPDGEVRPQAFPGFVSNDARPDGGEHHPPRMPRLARSAARKTISPEIDEEEQAGPSDSSSESDSESERENTRPPIIPRPVLRSEPRPPPPTTPLLPDSEHRARLLREPFLMRNMPKDMRIQVFPCPAQHDPAFAVIFYATGPRPFSWRMGYSKMCCPFHRNCSSYVPRNPTYEDVEEHLRVHHPDIKCRLARNFITNKVVALDLTIPPPPMRVAGAPRRVLGKGRHLYNKSRRDATPVPEAHATSQEARSTKAALATTSELGHNQRPESVDSWAGMYASTTPASSRFPSPVPPTSRNATLLPPTSAVGHFKRSPSEEPGTQALSSSSSQTTSEARSPFIKRSPSEPPESRGLSSSYSRSPSDALSTITADTVTPSIFKKSESEEREQRELSLEHEDWPEDDFGRRRPIDLPAEFPDPPPRNNLHGPAARRPYLREASPGEVQIGDPYSTRTGGEKLYDILSELPTDEFGFALADIHDREEEIFESDDLSDEMKAMYALWARWIWWPKNRMLFVRDGLKGVKEFLELYSIMIHRCCGLAVLQSFLVTLITMRLLKGPEAAKCIKIYTDKTGLRYLTV